MWLMLYRSSPKSKWPRTQSLEEKGSLISEKKPKKEKNNKKKQKPPYQS
jgi:hypothetical protein